MITNIDAFVRWFSSVNKRAIRDIGALGEQASGWHPAQGEGEKGWSIGEIVKHMSESRLYFASAFRGEGWLWGQWEEPFEGQTDWLPTLQRSFELFSERVSGSDPAWLTRRIELIGGEGEISGWRVLMMMAEHDVHHRSQIETYAGINGWEVRHIFDRTAEWVLSKQPEEIVRTRAGGDSG